MYIITNNNGTHVTATEPRIILGSGPEHPPAKMDVAKASEVVDTLNYNSYMGNPPYRPFDMKEIE